MRKVPEVIVQADKPVSITLTNQQWYNIARMLQSNAEVWHYVGNHEIEQQITACMGIIVDAIRESGVIDPFTDGEW